MIATFIVTLVEPGVAALSHNSFPHKKEKAEEGGGQDGTGTTTMTVFLSLIYTSNSF